MTVTFTSNSANSRNEAAMFVLEFFGIESEEHGLNVTWDLGFADNDFLFDFLSELKAVAAIEQPDWMGSTPETTISFTL